MRGPNPRELSRRCCWPHCCAVPPGRRRKQRRPVAGHAPARQPGRPRRRTAAAAAFGAGRQAVPAAPIGPPPGFVAPPRRTRTTPTRNAPRPSPATTRRSGAACAIGRRAGHQQPARRRAGRADPAVRAVPGLALHQRRRSLAPGAQRLDHSLRRRAAHHRRARIALFFCARAARRARADTGRARSSASPTSSGPRTGPTRSPSSCWRSPAS